MQPPRRFSYTPKWIGILGCMGFFGLCAAVMSYEASYNRSGVIIEGIIRLGPGGATTFYWTLAAGALLFVLAGLLLIVRRIGNPQILEFTEDALLLPHGFL